MPESNYDRCPAIPVPEFTDECWSGWESILARLNSCFAGANGVQIVAIECYTGIHLAEVERMLSAGLKADHFLTTDTVFKSEAEIEMLAAPFLGGDDPLFGFLSPLTIDAFLDAEKLATFRAFVEGLKGRVVIFGTAAVCCAQPDVIVYADMPRWEGQLRQRRGEVSNLGVRNQGERASLQYKRSYFLDWRVLDRLKADLLPRCDFLLDTTNTNQPRLITGDALRAGLDRAAHQPFRVVPFFDPAPWGGQWMKEVCGLDSTVVNYGWCFDGVPEENSLLLQFGETRVEIPALNLVLSRPRELLGDAVYALFGAEFPIRFDLLDTMGGGNLSLQVHPLRAYLQERFGLCYTQDESYYILDASDDASVYLGLKTGTSVDEMFNALSKAQAGGESFPAERFVNQSPARKHDHFLIPAGTLHCSGANTMVLEISATPYIFTFKLWDWGRLGLDGQPRPINLEHGRNNLQADRDGPWVREHLINQVELVAEGEGWREERTGLHPLEFIETRRHWFTGLVSHDTQGTLNVLCLVEGRAAVVESPTDAFAPFVVHYAETFIVPAAVGAYTIRPNDEGAEGMCATMKAFVRPGITELESASERATVEN